MKQGIIPVFTGGLGNQMFVVAAAFISHKEKKVPLYLLKNTLDNNKHNVNNFDYNDTIFKYIGIHLDKTFNEIKDDDEYKYFTYHKILPFQQWNVNEIEDGTIMYSYYQYYPVLQPFEKDLRLIFSIGLDNHRLDLSQRFNFTERVAFLHVRRGDFLEHQDIHYLTSDEYYIHCIKQIYNQVDKIIIISDDMTWIKENKKFQTIKSILFESNDEIETLALMSLCYGGAICSNSTYAWWGAFLGAYSVRAPVFVPKKWINVEEENIDLFPKDWNVIDL